MARTAIPEAAEHDALTGAPLGRALAARGAAATLNREQRSWSRVRQSLIEAGDMYAARRGVLEITVPALARYSLHEYLDLQRLSRERLAALEQMRQRAGVGSQP